MNKGKENCGMLHTPNEETLAAIEETNHSEKLKTYSLEEFKKLLEVNDE